MLGLPRNPLTVCMRANLKYLEMPVFSMYKKMRLAEVKYFFSTKKLKGFWWLSMHLGRCQCCFSNFCHPQ